MKRQLNGIVPPDNGQMKSFSCDHRTLGAWVLFGEPLTHIRA
jgi:hypothetical protein